MNRLGLMMVIMASACAGDSSVVEVTRLSHGTCERSGLPLTLGNLAIERDELISDVTTPGTCEAPTFSVCWDGSVFDSIPGQVDLMVRYKPNGGACEGSRTDHVRIDLGVLGDERPLDLNVLDDHGFYEGSARIRFE